MRPKKLKSLRQSQEMWLRLNEVRCPGQSTESYFHDNTGLFISWKLQQHPLTNSGQNTPHTLCLMLEQYCILMPSPHLRRDKKGNCSKATQVQGIQLMTGVHAFPLLYHKVGSHISTHTLKPLVPGTPPVCTMCWYSIFQQCLCAKDKPQLASQFSPPLCESQTALRELDLAANVLSPSFRPSFFCLVVPPPQPPSR